MSRFEALKQKLNKLDDSLDDIDKEEIDKFTKSKAIEHFLKIFNIFLMVVEPKGSFYDLENKMKSIDKVKSIRDKKKRLEDSDSDALAPSDDEVDYSIESVEHKGIQEIKLKEESPEVYGSDNFEDSLEDSKPVSSKPKLKKQKSDDLDSLEDSEEAKKKNQTSPKLGSESDHQGIQEFKIGDQEADEDGFGDESEETPKVKTKAKPEVKEEPIKDVKKEQAKETMKNIANDREEREVETIQEFKIGDQQVDDDAFEDDSEDTPKVENKKGPTKQTEKEPIKETKKESPKNIKKETAKTTKKSPVKESKKEPIKEVRKEISKEKEEREVETIQEFKIGQEVPSGDEEGFSDDFESENENKASSKENPVKNKQVKETPKTVAPKENQKKTQNKTPSKEVSKDKTDKKQNKTPVKEEKKAKKSESPQRKHVEEKSKSPEKSAKTIPQKITNQSKVLAVD